MPNLNCTRPTTLGRILYARVSFCFPDILCAIFIGLTQGPNAHATAFPNLDQEQIRTEFLRASDNKSLRLFSNVHERNFADGSLAFYLSIGDFKFRENDRLQLRPNASEIEIAKTAANLIYNATYSSDEYSHRVTIRPPLPSGEIPGMKRIVLLGCSYAFGDGLNDNETIASQLNRNRDHVYVSNWGIPGAGTNTILGQLEDTTYSASEHLEQVNLYIYIFLDGHIERTSGLLPALEWAKNDPYYELDENNHLTHKGSFMTGRPIATLALLGLQYIFGDNILKSKIFPKISKSDVEKTCSMIKQAEMASKIKSPNSAFLVYHHPQAGHSFQADLSDCLKKKEVPYLISQLQMSDEKHQIPIDKHPNQRSAAEVAQELYEKAVLQLK